MSFDDCDLDYLAQTDLDVAEGFAQRWIRRAPNALCTSFQAQLALVLEQDCVKPNDVYRLVKNWKTRS